MCDIYLAHTVTLSPKTSIASTEMRYVFAESIITHLKHGIQIAKKINIVHHTLETFDLPSVDY